MAMKQVDYRSSGDDNTANPAGLFINAYASDQTMWTNAAAVADFFIDLLYPAEGTGNLDADREECIRLLNSDTNGAPDSAPLALDATYDGKIRSAAGLLLANPKFHEQ